MECNKSVDPVWYWAMMRKERQKAREEEYRRQRAEQFQFKNVDQITEILAAECGPLSSSDVSLDTPEKTRNQESRDQGSSSTKKRKLFVEVETEANSFPQHLAHVRDSERKVKDSFYVTVSALSGRGMSVAECCSAVVEVANGIFDRQWKLPSQDSDTFDQDTLPDVRNIRLILIN